MKNDFLDTLRCPICKQSLQKKANNLVCKNNHRYLLKGKVPLMTEIDEDLNEEAKAWEDEWKTGLSKKTLAAYKKNMSIFKKLGFWEECGEAANKIKTEKDYVILDLGCGNGVSTAYLSGKTVVGVDLSLKQLIRAKKKYPNRNFLVGDATKLPFKSNTFDLIVAINLLHHLSDKTDTGLKECYRVLKKGGKLLTVDPNLTNPFGFTTRELFKLFKLKSSMPKFPQFALQSDEYQFTKDSYYKVFNDSPFKNFKIKGHRIERVTFFFSILIPGLAELPFFENIVRFTSTIGNFLVQYPPIDRLCYFWKSEAIK